MIAIIGLGNPDAMYQNTYHNTGFNVVDMFAKQHNVSLSKFKYSGRYGECKIGREKVMILKPMTYMNNSGKAVSELVSKLKLPLSRVIVVYDDIDLPVGVLRLRASGSAGTHNGMRSIVSMLGSEAFPRLRVGIGRNENMQLADYVLSKISPLNMSIYTKTAYPLAVKTLDAWIENDCNTEKVDITRLV